MCCVCARARVRVCVFVLACLRAFVRSCVRACGRACVMCLQYTIIIFDLLDTLKDALFIFNEQSQKLGLHVNWSKTKLQSFSPWIPTPPSTLIGTQPVTTTDNFTYLGSTIASNNSSLNDVNRRIAIATSTMSNLSSLWTSSRLSLALKMRLYNSLII